MERKRERPSEAAEREFWELYEIIHHQYLERGPWWPPELPPPAPGEWPPLQMKRLLDLAAEKGKFYVYTWILHRWLSHEHVRVPREIFSKKIHGPGTGRKPSERKREDGKLFRKRQIELIRGDMKGLSESEITKRERLARAARPSLKSAQIAKEFRKREYELGGKERNGAITYVKEAIAAVKTAELVDAITLRNPYDWRELVDTMMAAAKPPFN